MPMRLLILGGTIFLGRHLVATALARGHAVTLFNRGQHNPDLFPDVAKVRGDRTVSLDALADGRWDAVIDTSGYVPRVVRLAATTLADRVDHYTFISSLSVYADPSRPGVDETAPVGRIDDPTTEEITGESYGPLKALCEQAAEAALPGRALIIRPGLIVGPYDPTDRFTYWPRRVAHGGAVLAPGRPGYATQIIDARDLAEWTLDMVEARRVGVYNATGPATPLTLGEVLDTSRAVSGSDATFTWLDEAFLLAHGAQPWTELPLWVPESDPQLAGFNKFSIDRALAAGLTFRPLADTVAATLAWDAARPTDTPPRAGLTREREAELLAAWRARRDEERRTNDQ